MKLYIIKPDAEETPLNYEIPDRDPPWGGDWVNVYGTPPPTLVGPGARIIVFVSDSGVKCIRVVITNVREVGVCWSPSWRDWRHTIPIHRIEFEEIGNE